MTLALRHPLATIILFALLVRAWTFGNPVLHVDDQFYVLVGERLMQGALPYVDLWDRKPFGLFLIYGLAGKLPGDPVIGYQIVATLFVIGTGWLIYRMASKLAGPAPALAGALAYVAWLPLFGGIGGQSPVFYNLLIAMTAMILMQRVTRPDSLGLTRVGCVVMLIIGAALQIKYSVLFEGMFFGLTLMWLGWKSGRSLAQQIADAALWVVCALLPTALVWSAYAALGHGEAFYQANFLSVFQDAMRFDEALARLFWQMIGLLPFWLCLGVLLRRWSSLSRDIRWLIGWTGASLGGFLLFGNWFDHYVLPLFVPLCVIAAMGLAQIRHQRLAAALLILIGLAAGLSRAAVDMLDRGTTGEVANLAALVEQHRGTGCIYVTEDIVALYVLTHSCLPTPYIMPDHLALKRYGDALGAVQAQEMQKLLARKPSVIVFLHDSETEYAAATRTMLLDDLKQNYRAVGQAQTGAKLFTVFARR